MHHELWLTAILNQFLSGPANAILGIFGIHAHDPSKPFTNFMAMQLLVFALLLTLPLFLGKPSVDRPSKFQQLCELIFGFIREQSQDVVGHHGPKYMAFFGTLFLFILVSNLLGIVPTFESPTMYAPVPLGCAVAAFVFYNYLGVQYQGVVHYLGHFAGPVWWLAPFMFPLEIFSHIVRLLSLTVRLFANMLAGELVTISFLKMAPLLIPVIFMGLHTFVSLLQAFIFMVLAMSYVSEATATAEAH
jgi:F-type H+-transporting ATPase subunit a